MKKIKLLIFACILCVCINVNAATYTSSGARENSNGYLKETFTDGPNGGSLATWNLSNGDQVFCIKPGAGIPNNGTKFVEDKLDSKKQAVFDYVCSQVKDLPEDDKSVILKLASVKAGKVTIAQGSSVYAYKAFFETKSAGGYKTIYNSPNISDEKVRKILNDAANNQVEKKTAITATAEDDKITVISNGNEVKVSVGAGYKVDYNGNPATEVTLDGKNEAYILTVTADDGSCLDNVPVTVSYDKTKSTGNTATAKYYRPANGGFQDGISCNYSGDDSCDANFTLNGDRCDQILKVDTCGKTPDKPKIPDKKDCTDKQKVEVTVNNGDKDGKGKCQRNGDTLVEAKEGPSTAKKDIDDEILCLKEDERKNATKVVLNATNEFCSIYCTEQVKLVLPGPDSTNNDEANKDMFINAGTYFNITGDKYSEDKITCYGINRFDEYETQVNGYRKKVMEAANKYQESAAIDNANKKNFQKVDEETKECTYTSSAGSYKECRMDETNGTISCTNESLNGKTCTTTNLAQIEAEYNSTYSEAKSKIEALNKEWNQCFEWDFTNLNAAIKGCGIDVDFKYGAAECTEQKIEIEDTSFTPTADFNTDPIETTELNTGLCDKNMTNCTEKTKVKSQLVYSQQETVKNTYKFSNNKFTLNLETNEISCDAETGDTAVWSDVMEGFPVRFDAVQGEYQYEYTYKNVGYWFDKLTAASCEKGRLDESIEKEKNYYCWFNINSCDNCKVRCSADGVCEIDTPDCDANCRVSCAGGGCIMDGYGGFMANYKVISLNSNFVAGYHVLSNTPNLTLAYASTQPTLADHSFDNWKTEKGLKTSDIISNKNGEEIYGREPDYSVTLPVNKINKIKDYNETVGYANSTLKCKKVYEVNSAGQKYDYGICTSEFVHNNPVGLTYNIGSTMAVDTSVSNINEFNGVKFATYRNIDVENFTGPAWK